MSRIQTYSIQGMHCASCERLIGNVLHDAAGVKDVRVSLSRKEAVVELHDGAKLPDVDLLNQQLNTHGYVLQVRGSEPAAKTVTASPTCQIPGREALSTRIGRALAALGLMGAMLLFLSPLRGAVPALSSSASIGAMIAFGLVASVSSCLATTGGFLLAYTTQSRTRKKLVAVHAGRLIAFVIGGAVLGAVGGSLPNVSSFWYGVFTLVLGIGFLAVALNLLELSPSLARFGIRLPSQFYGWGDRIATSRHPIASWLVGAVTFILPCGFTQTAQALALTTGSPFQGALFLGAFALGTLPMLVGLTMFGSSSSTKHRAFRLATGALLVFFALNQMSGGFVLLGIPFSVSALTSPSDVKGAMSVATPTDAKEQVVKMTVAYGTYQPSRLVVKKGVPVRWEIDGKDVYGCANSIVVPSLNIGKALSPGLNIITFTPTRTGTIPFSCGMGMIRGSFTVVE